MKNPFAGKSKIESLTYQELLSLPDKGIDKILKGKKETPYRNAKELRKAARERKLDEKQTIRATIGEKSVGALIAGLRGGGTGNRNQQNIPLKDRVHPAEYERILNREAKKQGLL